MEAFIWGVLYNKVLARDNKRFNLKSRSVVNWPDAAYILMLILGPPRLAVPETRDSAQ